MFTNKWANSLKTIVAAVAVSICSNAQAADIAFPDVPLFLKEELAPNIILTLDNSTSMQRADIFDAGVFCPDVNSPETSNPTGRTVFRTCWTDPGLNKLYYNPNITYELPLRADGSSFPNADFNNASVDGFDPTAATVNLAVDYIPTYNYLRLNGDEPLHEFVDFEFNNKRAYYATLDPTIDNDPDSTFPECNNLNNNFNSEFADSCFVINSVSTEQEQNFANWYSYYRNRLLITKSAASIAFGLVGDDVRVGWNDINILTTFNETGANFVSPFIDQHKTNFYTWLAEMEQNFGTPLIPALQRVGEYMSSTDNLNPFALTPGISADDYDPSTDLSCRQNYNVMFTDGAWTYDPAIEIADNDFDNISTTLPDGTVFAAGTPPYSAPLPAAGYLADWSFFYWARDLRPDLDDSLTPFIADPSGSDDEQFFNPSNDPATWQHLVNYTVSLGVDGNLPFPESLPGLVNGSIDWPTNGSSEPTRIDDTWHAAVNSRGAYFSASNTTELTDAFTDILNRIGDRDASASSISTDSTQTADTRFIYRASFNSGEWTGTLQGFEFTDLTIGNMIFDAGCILTGGFCESNGLNLGSPQSPISTNAGARRIITSTGTNANTSGIPFRANTLSAEQFALLDPDPAIANQIGGYIRGLRSDEQQNGGSLRDRESILGDIVASSPSLVYIPQRIYPNNGDWENQRNDINVMPENNPTSESFADFFLSVDEGNRDGIVYVGANDGMLHAFNGVNGTEEFAYIPSVLLPELANLTDPDYTHQFYVDGTPFAGEAFFSSDGQWHTVLTGHLRTGGQMVYALDVTEEPALADTESTISNKLLWEFTDPDLGFGNGEPEIARLHNGEWAVIFGNGYNNTQADESVGSGSASVFIVNIETGELIRKIDTNVGTTTNSNGIGSVVAVDSDGDFITDYVYGGDLLGNMWKFDLTTTNPDDWDVSSLDDDGNPEPFFRAVTDAGVEQAITEKPSIVLNPAGGLMVIFGTGKYLEESDITDNTVVNSYYGLWDRDIRELEPPNFLPPTDLLTTTMERSHLSRRTLSGNIQNSTNDTVIRTISGDTEEPIVYDDENPTDLGWFFDFFEGELQFTQATEFNTNLIAFTTFEPSLDECTRGGISFLFVISTFQGKDPGFIPFDVDNDGFFTEDDEAANGLIASAKQLEGGGVIAPLNILSAGREIIDGQIVDKANILIPTINQDILEVGIQDLSSEDRGGRVQWRQIK